ncbi:MAG: methylenetetrahydrofolate reductase [Clostridiales Family XIII bacterium]|jgi:methylenetetrahydrofolate reductase (NADPH)|nr:methylenetetrahydrofolate reductase [Clostridiales Family XIII bacterium]
MKIAELLKKKRTFSFEVFPPKDGQPMEPLQNTLSHLYKFNPDFISITYGAGGTNEGRSVEVCKLILESGVDVMPHFTCIGNTFDKVEQYASNYLDIGIENILLLRGDLPEGWTGTKGDFEHASDLIGCFKEKHPNLCIGAAAYPEIHIESDTIDEDIQYLKLKQDLGAEFFTTQLCHDVHAYERFMNRIRSAGVTIPVIVGVMPIISRDGAIRMSLSNGVSIPAELSAIMGRYKDDAASFKEAGMEYTERLLGSYIDAGAEGIHLYTLNKYKDISEIIELSGVLDSVTI